MYSGMWFFRWARAGANERVGGWLGLFSGMVCVGSVAGAVTWGASMQSNNLDYEGQSSRGTRRQHYTLHAAEARWSVAFLIFYSFEFLCLVVSKLMLLGRLATNAAQSSQSEMSGMSGVRRAWLSGRALPIVYRVMAGAVVVGSVVGMVANAVAAAHNDQVARLHDQAAAACDSAGKDTSQSLEFKQPTSKAQASADSARSVQFMSEAVTLLLVSVAFVAIVSWSVVLFRLMERLANRALITPSNRYNIRQDELRLEGIVNDTMHAAAEQRRRLTGACIIVLLTFPARAVFDTLSAYSAFNDPRNLACDVCSPCQTDQHLIHTWLSYTPAFQPVVVALSSPLPLTWSLYLITKAHSRLQLIDVDVQPAGLQLP